MKVFAFDGIIADLPCTGSGTWEELPKAALLPEEEIAKYAALQLDIVSQAYKVLKPDGRLFYITCSRFPTKRTGRILNASLPPSIEMCPIRLTISITPDGGDTLFVAGLEKPSRYS